MSSVPRSPTYYDVLDVDPHADVEVIHAAWRRMATLVHPDATLERSDPVEYADRNMLMKTVNAAWETLGDASSRATYDTDIGLDHPLTRLTLRLRRVVRAAGRPRVTEPLRLHRPSLLSRPPLLAEAQALAHFVWGTRMGQWLLLIAVVALIELAGAGAPEGIRGPLALGALVLTGLVLARGGEPTPAADAAHVSLLFVRRGRRLTGHLGHTLALEGLAIFVTRPTPPAPPETPATRRR